MDGQKEKTGEVKLRKGRKQEQPHSDSELFQTLLNCLQPSVHMSRLDPRTPGRVLSVLTSLSSRAGDRRISADITLHHHHHIIHQLTPKRDQSRAEERSSEVFLCLLLPLSVSLYLAVGKRWLCARSPSASPTQHRQSKIHKVTQNCQSVLTPLQKDDALSVLLCDVGGW